MSAALESPDVPEFVKLQLGQIQRALAFRVEVCHMCERLSDEQLLMVYDWIRQGATAQGVEAVTDNHDGREGAVTVMNAFLKACSLFQASMSEFTEVPKDILDRGTLAEAVQHAKQSISSILPRNISPGLCSIIIADAASDAGAAYFECLEHIVDVADTLDPSRFLELYDFMRQNSLLGPISGDQPSSELQQRYLETVIGVKAAAN
jgi:hypothetical protein